MPKSKTRKLSDMTKAEHIELLRTDVAQWNELLRAELADNPSYGSNLRYSNLSGSNLSGSDLRGSNLRYSNLSGSNLSGSNLSGSDLRYSNLSGSNLRYSNLSGSNLSGSNLRYSNLSGSNLSGSDLRGSNLRYSNLSGSNLSGSNQSHKLVGGYFHAGIIGGHTVQVFETETGHVVTAGCWMGTVDGIEDRAVEEWGGGGGIEVYVAQCKALPGVIQPMLDYWAEMRPPKGEAEASVPADDAEGAEPTPTDIPF